MSARAKSVWGLGAFLIAGCQFVSGLSGLEVGTGTVADDAGPGPDAQGATDAATEGATPANLLSGALHFLQPGDSVVVGNGTEELTLSANGSFAFKESLPPGEAYDVQVKSQPPGQACWVLGGKGTMGAANPPLEVRCTILRKSIGDGSPQVVRVSDNLVGMADVQPIVVTTDIPSRVFVALSVPNVFAAAGFQAFRIGIEIDGRVVSFSRYRIDRYPDRVQLPAFAMATPGLPAGKHTIRAVWQADNTCLGPCAATGVLRPNAQPAGGTPIAPELDAVVIDSSAAFDRVIAPQYTYDTVIHPGTTAPFVDTALGSPIMLPNAPGQRAFVALQAQGLNGGDAFVRLRSNGTAFGYAHRLSNEPCDTPSISSFATMGLLPTDMPTSVTASLGRAGGAPCDVILNAGPKPAMPLEGSADASALYALLLRPKAIAANAATMTRSGEFGGTSPNFFPVPGASTSITVSKPSRALLYMVGSGVQYNKTTAGLSDDAIEIASFVGPQRGPTLVVGGDGRDLGYNFRTSPFAAMGIVDLPSGTTILDMRARSLHPWPIKIGSEGFASPDTSHYGIGAIVLTETAP